MCLLDLLENLSFVQMFPLISIMGKKLLHGENVKACVCVCVCVRKRLEESEVRRG